MGFACGTNQWDIAEILLKYGADMNVVRIDFSLVCIPVYSLLQVDSNRNNILHMLVICNLPEIYAKFKARWLEKKLSAGIYDVFKNKGKKPKTMKQTNLWNRLNNDNLTPLTLAADLSRTHMLSWLLNERKIVQWSYGDVSCVLHPLEQLDVDFQDNVR